MLQVPQSLYDLGGTHTSWEVFLVQCSFYTKSSWLVTLFCQSLSWPGNGRSFPTGPCIPSVLSDLPGRWAQPRRRKAPAPDWPRGPSFGGCEECAPSRAQRSAQGQKEKWFYNSSLSFCGAASLSGLRYQHSLGSKFHLSGETSTVPS